MDYKTVGKLIEKYGERKVVEAMRVNLKVKLHHILIFHDGFSIGVESREDAYYVAFQISQRTPGLNIKVYPGADENSWRISVKNPEVKDDKDENCEDSYTFCQHGERFENCDICQGK